MISKDVNYRAAVDLIDMAVKRVPMVERLRDDFATISAWFSAQEQMAGRLHAAFEQRRDLMVLNDVAFELGGNVLQLDHLVLGSTGGVVIDSRSISGTVQVDANGQWSRLRGERFYPVVCPVKHIEKLQESVVSVLSACLQKALPPPEEHQERQNLFDHFPVDGYAAVAPDTDLQNYQVKSLGPLVRTQDEVVRAIDRRFEPAERSSFPRLQLFRRNKKRPPPDLKPDELATVASLVLKHDRAPVPVRMVSDAIMDRCHKIPGTLRAAIRRIADSAATDRSIETLTSDTFSVLHFCRHCSADDLRIEDDDGNGRFVCIACGEESPLEPVCAECGGNGTLTRVKKTFFIRCSACGKERVFFFNR